MALDPFTQALLMAGASAGMNQLVGGGPQTQNNAAPPVGGPQMSPVPPMQPPQMSPAPAGVNPLSAVLAQAGQPGVASLAPPVQGNPSTAAQAANKAESSGEGAPAPEGGATTADYLAAAPEALAAMATLLGFGPGNPQRPAPIAGGAPGQVMPGFNIPQPNALGAFLSQIPQAR